MKKRVFGVVFVLLVACVVTGYFVFRDEHKGKQQIKEGPSETLSVKGPAVVPTNEIPAVVSMPTAVKSVESRPEVALAKPVESENEEGDKEEIYKMFRVDKRGRLVLNEGTRLNIEKLYALNTPEELEKKLQKLSTAMPPTAQRQLIHLIEQFRQYITESKEKYPPEAEVRTVEEALDEVKGLYLLRVRYFGIDVAEAFYGEEDRMNWKLMELMRVETDEKMTVEQKAEKALLLIQSDPGLAIAYDPERDGLFQTETPTRRP